MEEAVGVENTARASAKKLMYVNRRAPYGTGYALEGLEAALAGAAFEQDVSIVFLDDGVFLVKKGQDTADAGIKNFSLMYRALKTYDVEKLYVEKESMEQRGLTLDDLLVAANLVSQTELVELIEQQDVILNF
ncbi:MAG: sulfurtransferase complex subunit TusC [Acidiferrobacterales bacterium]